MSGEGAAHTPGPWVERALVIDGATCNNYREISGGAECEPQTDDTAQWGYVSLRISGYISPANAALITAAPELLAQLKECASWCAECEGTGQVYAGTERIDHGAFGVESVPIAGPCEDCADLRALIAKAEGRG